MQENMGNGLMTAIPVQFLDLLFQQLLVLFYLLACLGLEMV